MAILAIELLKNIMDQSLWKQMRSVTATEESWYNKPAEYGDMLMVIADEMDAAWPARGGNHWMPTEWLRDQARAAYRDAAG